MTREQTLHFGIVVNLPNNSLLGGHCGGVVVVAAVGSPDETKRETAALALMLMPIRCYYFVPADEEYWCWYCY